MRTAVTAPTGSLARLSRWLSLRAYGLVASTLFGAGTPPARMRARYERFAAVSRESLRRKHPQVVFEDLQAGAVAIEAIRATDAPTRSLVHLHGGGYFMGSPASYRNRAMRLAFR